MHNSLNWKVINPSTSIAHFSSAQDGQQIYVKKWHAKAVSNNEKVVFLFHDICQYHGRFESFIHWIQENDESISFVAMDFVGHGLSSGTRAHFDEFDVLVKDIFYLLNTEDKKENQEWIILAHGLGGLGILDLVNKYPAQFSSKINALIISNFIFNFKANPYLNYINKNLSGLNFISRVRLLKIFEGHEITTDNHEATMFEKDSLIVHRPTNASLLALKEKSANVYRDAYFLDWPILVLQSGNDKFLLTQGMDYFLKGIKKTLLTEKHYSNLKRDLYNEKYKELVFKDLLEWINTYEK
jgi:alpha-beta hydrolase superfamily lysophospholipase